MKDKIFGLLGKIVEHKKVVLPVVAVVAVIIIVAIVAAILGGGPSKYENKIKDFTKALYSESKMKSAFDKIFDAKAAVAWEEADGDTKDFKKEYKKIKKDDDEISDMKDDLKKIAEKCEDSEMKFKVSKIKKPKKDSKNKNIYTVSATLSYEYNGSSSSDATVKFVFYKNKIIDIIEKDSKESFITSLRKFL